jgi:hypothetical protein
MERPGMRDVVSKESIVKPVIPKLESITAVSVLNTVDGKTVTEKVSAIIRGANRRVEASNAAANLVRCMEASPIIRLASFWPIGRWDD